MEVELRKTTNPSLWLQGINVLSSSIPPEFSLHNILLLILLVIHFLDDSKRALNREREMLIKQVQKRFSRKEMETIYQKWGIDLDSKQRKLQLARRIWSDIRDMNHIRESAALVAKLVGFIVSSEAPQEIFGLSFSPKPMTRRSYSWRSNVSSLSGV